MKASSAGRGLHAYLRRQFVPLMPEDLRRPLADGLAAGPLTWSATGFRTRVYYGLGTGRLPGVTVFSTVIDIPAQDVAAAYDSGALLLSR